MDRRGSRGAPLIGLSTSELRRPSAVQPLAEGEPARCELALGIAYVEAVDRAGGRPVIIPPLPPESAAEIVAPLDALLVPGGPERPPTRLRRAARPRPSAHRAPSSTRSSWRWSGRPTGGGCRCSASAAARRC
jgi:gamma-glutamyl-gamma-aminobutyrate hydrolase PuuD